MNTYHITFGTYGTRLHGDERPTVRRPENHYGEPFVAPNRALKDYCLRKMIESACYFTPEQCLFVEDRIPVLCERDKWSYGVAACGPDHVHVLLSAEAESKAVRKWLKTWLSQALNEQYEKRTWFAEGGSRKRVFDDNYYNNIYRYILQQRTHGQS